VYELLKKLGINVASGILGYDVWVGPYPLHIWVNSSEGHFGL